MSDGRYRAFLSYSHSDRQWGDWLHRALETYRVPAKLVGVETAVGRISQRLTPIFRDRDDLAAADDLTAEIEAALEQSRFLIIVCSPAAARSKWVNEEILRYKRMHGEGRILAAIVDGEPFASDDTESALDECFPPALRYRMGPGGELTSQRAEPIAADFRPGGDGRKYGRSKIAAGMLGIRLDDLIRREAHRQMTRMGVVSGASLLLAAAMGLLSYATVTARNEAQLQRTEAEGARDDAEGLIEFMLTDLREKLDAVGRLDALEAVGARALQYYRQQHIETTNADALSRRARTQLLIGEVDNLRGDLDSALAAYTQAMLTTEEQLRRDPTNARRIFDHAQSVFYVGYIAWQRGDLETATRRVMEYLQYAQELVRMDPENPEWQTELGYAAGNLGAILFDQRKWVEALDQFQRSLEVDLANVSANPTDIPAKLDLGQDYSFIGETLSVLGRYDEAVHSFESEIRLYDEILSVDKLHQIATIRRMQAELFLARIAIDRGEITNAIAGLETLRDKLEVAIPAQVDDMRLPEMLTSVESHLAIALAASASTAEADEAAQRALVLARQLASRDAEIALWQANYGNALIQYARVRGLPDDPELTREIEAQQKVIQENLERASSDPFLVFAAARIEQLLGEIAARGGDAETAEAHWRRGLSVLPVTPEMRMPNEQFAAFALHSSLGDAQQAAEIATGLDAIGYRHPEYLQLKSD